MKIEQPALSAPQGNINKGPKAGAQRFYRDALYATLCHLKPKVCLEIGTHTGNATRVFQRYFDEQMSDGLLITCDIKQYADLKDLKNVVQLQVYPHVKNIPDWHPVRDDEMIRGWEDTKDSEFQNFKLVRKALTDRSLWTFDFVFIDGDHQRDSVYKDLKLSLDLLSSPKYILLDDTDEFDHDCAAIYHQELKSKYNTYEFDDWSVATGAALLWEKS